MIFWLLGCPATPVTSEPPTDPPSTEVPTDTAPPPRHNVLIVLADDVGLDNVGVYDAHPHSAKTPTIDSLAEQGVRFDRAWGTPACSPARTQLLTGRFGRRYGLGSIVRELQIGYEPYDLPEEEVTLGELAQGVGYHTAFIGKWHMTSYQLHWRDAPGRHGFDRYRFVMGNLRIPSVFTLNANYYNWQRNDNGSVAFTQEYATTVQTDDAIEELAQLEEPWLMVVAYNAGHEPFHVPPAHLHTVSDLTPQSSHAQKFRAMVEAMDTEIARLLAEVDLTDTHVVFTADNGTPVQALLPPTPPDQGKPSSTEGGLEVPLIIAGPSVDSPGVSQMPTQHADIFPTVASWIGATDVPNLDGLSLTPWLDDPLAPDGRTVQYAERFTIVDEPEHQEFITLSVREGRYKYKVFNGQPGLYDLEATGWDTEDLNQITAGTADPGIVEHLSEAMAQIRADAPHEHSQEGPVTQ